MDSSGVRLITASVNKLVGCARHFALLANHVIVICGEAMTALLIGVGIAKFDAVVNMVECARPLLPQ